MSRRSAGAWSTTALAVLIGLGASAVVGVVTAAVLFSIGGDDCSASGDVLCGLDGAIVAVLGGLAAGTGVYVVSGLLVIRRRLPAGGRVGPTAIFLVAPLAAMIGIGYLSEILG